MSAVPVTLPVTGLLPGAPLAIGRAYGELVGGLTTLADAIRRGDLSGVLPAPAAPPTILRNGDLRDIRLLPEPGRALRDRLIVGMAIEAAKTGVAVLVVYQGALTLLPSPARPAFAVVPVEASPAADDVVPSLSSASPRSVGGQEREVERDANGRFEPPAAP